MATVRKREGKNGVSYLIRVSSGYDSKGKQIVHSMTWKPDPGMKRRAIEKELNRQIFQFEEQCAGRSTTGGSMKFENFSRNWFREYAEKKLRPRTIDRLHQLEERSYTALGHIRLDKLTHRHIQSFINSLQEPGISRRKSKTTAKQSLSVIIKAAGYTKEMFAEKSGVSTTTLSCAFRGESVSLETAERIAQTIGKKVPLLFTVKTAKDSLSPKTIRNYHSFVSSVLDYAVKMGDIATNPAHSITLPPLEKNEKEVYTLEEVQTFLALLEEAPTKYRSFFTLAIYGGFRRSELLGLEWGDLDFEHHTVTVRRTSHYTKSRGIYSDTTKTVNSQRSLKLPDCVFTVLRQHKEAQTQLRMLCGPAWEDTERLFTGKKGGVMSPGTPYHWLERFCKRNGLRFLGVHQFRHLNAALLITSGVDARTVSAALGHSQVSTTLNIYSHTLQKLRPGRERLLQRLSKAR